MAIWQYDIWLIPRSASEDFSRLGEDRFPKNEYDTPDFWKDHPLDINLKSRLSEILPPMKSGLPDLMLWGSDDGNRIDLWMTNHRIDSLGFRIDLRNLSMKFVCSILSLAVECDCVLMNDDAHFINPDMEDLKKDYLASDAFRFVKDPRGFLDNLPPQDE